MITQVAYIWLYLKNWGITSINSYIPAFVGLKHTMPAMQPEIFTNCTVITP